MNQRRVIPLTKPNVPLWSLINLVKSLKSHHQQGDGNYGQICLELLRSICHEESIFLTPSCTQALEMASMLIDVQEDDEVIMPSFNFTSSAISVVKFGGKPIFVDIDPITKCIDIDATRKAITPKTKAISFVNYGGMTPELDELIKIRNEYNILLIEDNAHALGNRFRGRTLGKTGDFVTYSFHATKNFQCGEGGALVIRNEQFVDRAHILREKGTNRRAFLEKVVDKYTWVDKGSSYLLSEIQAAVLAGQLLKYETIQSKRYHIFEYYQNSLSIEAHSKGVKGMFEATTHEFASHLFFLEF
jgi:dTDP-4-amino-4,6-dideoxygalactose transaminase